MRFERVAELSGRVIERMTSYISPRTGDMGRRG
jgi:hypothetical protein